MNGGVICSAVYHESYATSGGTSSIKMRIYTRDVTFDESGCAEAPSLGAGQFHERSLKLLVTGISSVPSRNAHSAAA